MAERRMFTQKITESDAFLEMPMSAQALYFHLCMNADDDGFVKNPKRINRMMGGNDDDLKILIMKVFIIPYDSGVVVIKHWRMHNLLRHDRYKPSEYFDEKSMLYIKENGAYTLDSTQGEPLLATKWQPNGNQMAPQDSIDKYSIDKNSILNNLSPAATEKPKKETQKDILTRLLAVKNFDETLEMKLFEWVEYKSEIKSSYKERGLKALLTEVENKVKEYGTAKVVDVINKSMARGYKGIIFEMIDNNKAAVKKTELDGWAEVLNGSTDWS